MTSSPPSPWELPAMFPIRDASGELQAFHQRIERRDGKSYVWLQPDGVTLGLAGRSSTSLPLFGSEEVALHPIGQPIIVVEGEKAMWGLSQLGQWPVLGTVCGASSDHTIDALSPIAKDRIFILWPDNDDIGRRHMDALAQNLLHAGAKKVSVIDVPTGWAKGFDAWDFIQPETFPEFPRQQWFDAVIDGVRSLVSSLALPVVKEDRKEPQQLRIHMRTDSMTSGLISAEELAMILNGKRGPDGQWKAKCPAHDDKVASLSIGQKADGGLLLNCFAGCDFVSILSAAGVV